MFWCKKVSTHLLNNNRKIQVILTPCREVVPSNTIVINIIILISYIKIKMLLLLLFTIKHTNININIYRDLPCASEVVPLPGLHICARLTRSEMGVESYLKYFSQNWYIFCFFVTVGDSEVIDLIAKRLAIKVVKPGARQDWAMKPSWWCGKR